MRYRSKKTEAIYVQRRKLVAQLLKERPSCEACLPLAAFNKKQVFIQRPSEDIHEIVRRSQGGSILDIDNLLAVCRVCHTWVTENPWDAANVGLHLPGWADEKMFEEAARLRASWAAGKPARASWKDEYDTPLDSGS